MTQKPEPKWLPLKYFIEGYMQQNTEYRAGDIYQAYLDENSSADIPRKIFEMFLRDQVSKKDGILKRVSHGVYTLRTDPKDRGIFFTRGSSKKTELSLDEILDESMELTSKMDSVFHWLSRQKNISFSAQVELNRIQLSLMKSMDTVVTDITATMSWWEDNMGMDDQDEKQSMEMEGI